MILDYFDGAFYLNLDNRTERKEAFETRSKEAGLDIERFPAYVLKEEDVSNPFNNVGWHIKISCTYSHFKMIEEAKKRGWKNCLIFEDDAIFIEGFQEKIRTCIDELKNEDWDIFYLGGEPESECYSISNSLAKCVTGLYGTHAYAINEKFYDRVLNIPYEMGIIDTLYMCVDRNQKSYLMAKELLVWQDDDFVSDLWDGKILREKQYREAYKKWIISN